METRVRQRGCWVCLGMRCGIGCRRLALLMREREKRNLNTFPKQHSSEVKKHELHVCRSMLKLQSLRWTPSGECCQWVLDAVSHTVEWLSQPLGFESLTLRRSLDDIIRLTTPLAAL